MLQLVAQIVHLFDLGVVKLEMSVKQVFLEIVGSIKPSQLVAALAESMEHTHEPGVFLVGATVTSHISGDFTATRRTELGVNESDVDHRCHEIGVQINHGGSTTIRKRPLLLW